MNKCDFCDVPNCKRPRLCSSGECRCANERYVKVLTSRNTHTSNKNVNIKKNTHNTNYGNKNKKY